jgi:mRNA-degrading endonuclease HigB of HigAB toxin-antitoxin module
MRVIALKHIRDFCVRHPQAAQALKASDAVDPLTIEME